MYTYCLLQFRIFTFYKNVQLTNKHQAPSDTKNLMNKMHNKKNAYICVGELWDENALFSSNYMVVSKIYLPTYHFSNIFHKMTC